MRGFFGIVRILGEVISAEYERVVSFAKFRAAREEGRMISLLFSGPKSFCPLCVGVPVEVVARFAIKSLVGMRGSPLGSRASLIEEVSPFRITSY